MKKLSLRRAMRFSAFQFACALAGASSLTSPAVAFLTDSDSALPDVLNDFGLYYPIVQGALLGGAQVLSTYDIDDEISACVSRVVAGAGFGLGKGLVCAMVPTLAAGDLGFQYGEKLADTLYKAPEQGFSWWPSVTRHVASRTQEGFKKIVKVVCGMGAFVSAAVVEKVVGPCVLRAAIAGLDLSYRLEAGLESVRSPRVKKVSQGVM